MTYLGFRSTEGEGEMGERPGLRDGALVWGWEGWVVGGWGEVGREGAAL